MSIVMMAIILIVLVLWIVVVEFKQVCIPPEEETIASKASGKNINVVRRLFVDVQSNRKQHIMQDRVFTPFYSVFEKE